VTPEATTVHVLLRRVVVQEAFKLRRFDLDWDHVKGLASDIRARGLLVPLLVWAEQGEDGEATGKHVLLDGFHRLCALKSIAETPHQVPAVVVQGNRQEALQRAIQANTLDSLPLTKEERVDAAWKLVCLPGKRIPVEKVARAAGVGHATVDRMRHRLVVLKATGREPTGRWTVDRRDSLEEEPEREPMEDEERRMLVQKIGEAVREALGKTPWQDEEIAGEALVFALGQRKARSIGAWISGSEDAEGDF
jgi:hypothetical protein